MDKKRSESEPQMHLIMKNKRSIEDLDIAIGGPTSWLALLLISGKEKWQKDGEPNFLKNSGLITYLMTAVNFLIMSPPVFCMSSGLVADLV